MSSDTLLVPPDAARLIESLRSTGYELNTAVADIIDNSIAAGAGEVQLRLIGDGTQVSKLMIADNGCGMERDDLINAMTYGSRVRGNPKSLGKFGLGLKTASTAVCRCLTVISRPGTGEPLAMRWDLDHVVERGAWELLIPEPAEDELRLLEELTLGGSGTVVVWERIDRFFRKTDGSAAPQEALQRSLHSLRHHLRMVFQRFLDPCDVRAPNLRLKIDEEIQPPWDPFCRDEPATELASEFEVDATLEEGGGSGTFNLRCCILPRVEEFSSPQAAQRARIHNFWEGFYVYREQRLIHCRDWLGIFPKEPQFELLRIEFSFDHDLDDVFQVDIKKSQLSLNERLRGWLEEAVLPEPKRLAEERYRWGRAEKATQKMEALHQRSGSRLARLEQSVKLAEYEGAAGGAVVRNRWGSYTAELPIQPEASGAVQVLNDLEDGMLWRPSLNSEGLMLQLNSGHPGYQKLYAVKNVAPTTVQALDSLFWALCQAELAEGDSRIAERFRGLRFSVSLLLEKLLQELPDAELEE